MFIYRGFLELLTGQTIEWGTKVVYMGVYGLRTLSTGGMNHIWIYSWH